MSSRTLASYSALLLAVFVGLTTTAPAQATPGTTTHGQPYTCDPKVGGVCDNRKLPGGRGCLDYRVRFCC